MSEQSHGTPGEIQMGPVTVVYEPGEAAELSQLLGHVLFNMPDHSQLNEQQIATAGYLSGAALKLSAGLVQAMKDAGVSDELIARVTGQIQASPVQTAQMEIVANEAMDELQAADAALGDGEPVNDPHLPTYRPEDDTAPAEGSNFHAQDPTMAQADPPPPVPDAPARANVQEPRLTGGDPPNPVPEGVPPRPGAQG